MMSRVLTCVLLLAMLAACSTGNEATPARADAGSDATAAVRADVAAREPSDDVANPEDAGKDSFEAAAPAAPEPARRVPEELLVQGGVNYACSVPADCAIKDIGSCCGYRPACVNKDSPTFPEQVKADCAKQGVSSICGFPAIESCDCLEGRCTGVSGPSGTLQ